MSTWTDYETFPPDVFETHSGRVVHPADLDPGDVSIEDIAYALSRIGRFGGHTDGRVAQHCLLVESILEVEQESALVRLQGLLHDGCEAFGLVDLPRSVKDMLPEYREMEARAMAAVYDGLGVPQPTPRVARAIKCADNASVLIEARAGLHSQGSRWSILTPDMLALVARYSNIAAAEVEERIAARERSSDAVESDALRELFVEKYEELRVDAADKLLSGEDVGPFIDASGPAGWEGMRE